jgi:hypothetical protein
MQAFAQPQVLRQAAIAAGLSALACVPRLYYWQDHPSSIWYLAGLLAWCLFVMWGFVFAWEKKYGAADPLPFKRSPRVWTTILIGGVIAAILAAKFTAPAIRKIMPDQYPESLGEVLAYVAFYVALEQIFICFAPLAFFARLSGKPALAAGMTVGVSLAVLWVKLGTAVAPPSTGLVIWLFAFRLAHSVASIGLYRWGGIWPVYALALIIQSRLLFLNNAS